MCGRYSLTAPPEAVARLFRLAGPVPNFAPRYNIAPTQEAPVVGPRPEGEGRGLAMLRWGLVPAWSEGPSGGPSGRLSLINARAETVRVKPAFRAAFKARRCLVPADGFYEWQAAGQGTGKGARKQPFRIARRDGAPFAFAGLWERWRPKGGDKGEQAAEPVTSFTIIVTEANALVRPIHHRMPVILDPDDHEAWLGGPPDQAEALLAPAPAEAFHAYPVSTRVNAPANDDPACIAPLGS